LGGGGLDRKKQRSLGGVAGLTTGGFEAAGSAGPAHGPLDRGGGQRSGKSSCRMGGDPPGTPEFGSRAVGSRLGDLSLVEKAMQLRSDDHLSGKPVLRPSDVNSAVNPRDLSTDK